MTKPPTSARFCWISAWFGDPPASFWTASLIDEVPLKASVIRVGNWPDVEKHFQLSAQVGLSEAEVSKSPLTIALSLAGSFSITRWKGAESGSRMVVVVVPGNAGPRSVQVLPSADAWGW